jgi:branched-chain amino acid aminotransferase
MKDEAVGNGEWVWWEGGVRRASEVGVGVYERGLLVGDGVFETLLCYGERIFEEGRHAARLARSGAIMGIGVPCEEELGEAMRAVMGANGACYRRLRVTVMGGEGVVGSGRSGEVGSMGRLLVLASVAPPVAEVARVQVVPWTRNERGALAGCKSTSYGENVVALSYARERGADEAIFGNTVGELCEGTGSNVFVVSGGEVVTPPLSSGCLAGVTREVVLELCGEMGIVAREEALQLAALGGSDEIFLTSTTREVQAVGEVDGVLVRAGVMGVVTGQLRRAFRGRVLG